MKMIMIIINHPDENTKSVKDRISMVLTYEYFFNQQYRENRLKFYRPILV